MESHNYINKSNASHKYLYDHNAFDNNDYNASGNNDYSTSSNLE